MTPHTTDAHDTGLASTRAVIVGMGGLGTPAAMALARAGVGELELIDPDVVEVSNLHRQPLYETNDVGVAKVTAAARRLRTMAPALRVDVRQDRFTPEAAEWLGGADVVLDGTDTIASKFELNDAAVAVGIPPSSPGESTRLDAVGRAVRTALHAVDSGSADLGQLSVTLSADTPFELGRLTARLEAALWCEWLRGTPGQPSADGLSVVIEVSGLAHRPGHVHR